jgi:hypothetical protein
MSLTAECPWCAILIKDVPDEQDGEKMDCPRCGKNFTVKGKASSSTGKKGGPSKAGASAKAQGVKANPYPTRKEFDAARAAAKARAEEARDEPDEAPVKTARAKQSEPDEDEEESSSGSGIPWFVISGIVAFLFGSVGTALASFPGLELIAVGLTLVGLLLGAVSFIVAFKQDTGTLYPVLGVVVCLPALLWCAYCYTQVPKPEKGRSAAELKKKTIVPLDRRSGEAPTVAQEGETVDSSREAQQQGDLRIAITSVSITTAPLIPVPGKKPPIDKFLIVQLRLSNVGVERKYDYSGWGQWGSESAATLRDTKGKVFKLKRFEGTWDVKGQIRSTSIFPGKSVDDILIFEAPPLKDIPSRLRLELPAAALGNEGNFIFEIPGKTISIPGVPPVPPGGKG